uniref:hypothetical protein n=1 Tax=Nocardioides ferulae TaxID=2340821 RepID=UPI00197F1FAB
CLGGLVFDRRYGLVFERRRQFPRIFRDQPNINHKSGGIMRFRFIATVGTFAMASSLLFGTPSNADDGPSPAPAPEAPVYIEPTDPSAVSQPTLACLSLAKEPSIRTIAGSVQQV